MTFKEKLDKLKIKIEIDILKELSAWVKDNMQYKSEAGDIWNRRSEIIRNNGVGDCDEYAGLIYDMAIKEFGFDQASIRMGIFWKDKNGKKEGHMAVLYYGENRNNPLVITSTGAISSANSLSLSDVKRTTGWYLVYSFNDENVWRHQK